MRARCRQAQRRADGIRQDHAVRRLGSPLPLPGKTQPGVLGFVCMLLGGPSQRFFCLETVCTPQHPPVRKTPDFTSLETEPLKISSRLRTSQTISRPWHFSYRTTGTSSWRQTTLGFNSSRGPATILQRLPPASSASSQSCRLGRARLRERSRRIFRRTRRLKRDLRSSVRLECVLPRI